MPRLADVIGAIMSEVTHGRRIADETTARLARHYQKVDLLSGLSVPRMRLAKVTLDIPIVVEGYLEESAPKVATHDEIVEKVSDHVDKMRKKEWTGMPAQSARDFRKFFSAELQKPEVPLSEAGWGARDIAASAAENALRSLGSADKPALADELAQTIIPAVRDYAADIAIKKPGKTGGLSVNVETEQLKDSAPHNVVRLHLSLLEQGLEWADYSDPHGAKKTKLVGE